MATTNKRKKATPAKACQPQAPCDAPAVQSLSVNAEPVAAALADSPAAAPAREEEVVVVYGPEGEAQTVAVAGDFNGWSPNAHPLERINPTLYAATLRLSPGEYQYKFVVDGTWVEDPHAPRHVANSYGSRNSVLLV